MKTITLLFILIASNTFGQIPSKANVIAVTGLTFNQVCNALLDSGYSIAIKDNDLQTVRTEPRDYPKLWSAKYVLNVRVKDTVAYFSGTFTAAGGEIWKDDPIYNHTNKKGTPYPKSLIGYPFIIMNMFALAFNQPVEYLIK